MAATTEKSMFSDILQNCQTLINDPDIFHQQNPDIHDNFKRISKNFYDRIVPSVITPTTKSKSLKSLLINGFDDEQIWQQLEIQNKNVVQHLDSWISQIAEDDTLIDVDAEESPDVDTKESAVNQVDTNYVVDDNRSSSDEEIEQDEDETSDDEYDLNEEALKNKNFSANINIDEEDSDFDEIKDEAEGKKKGKSRKRKESAVNHVGNNKSPSDEEMEQDADETSDDEYDLNEEVMKNKNISADINVDEEGSDFDEIKNEGKQKKKGKSMKYKSKVDDHFFKLSKLEEFLRLEDLKEEKARDDELDESDDDDEEEDIDLFQDIDDEMDDSEDESNQKSSKDYMYDDFFDGPESGDENVKHSDEEGDELDSEGGDIPTEDYDSEGAGDDEENATSEIKSKTPFQIEQENIQKQISEYEESMVTPKPWQLTGEVDVSKRPVDGLLDLPTDFEFNAKPIIIQDKEFNEKLESMIKTTIKNKAYSDGVRQEKPVKEVISMKKEIVIDQNKSKKGLAQEYEELYLKKQSKQEEEENPKHQEIRKFMGSLFPELYALFSHIPKPAVPDIKIVSNLPAITVEEVAPTSYSDVALLAPEEIKKRTGLTKSQTERTDTDKKRERRKKKLHQKMKQKKREKENDGKPLSSKATKQEKLQVLKKLKQHRNTKIANVGGEKIKSSKDFFERLQDTISSKISKGGVKPAKKKRKKA